VSYKWVKLSDVCERITDGSHFSPKTVDEGFPYITVRDIENDVVNFQSCKYVNARDFSELKKNGCSPKINDLLFSKDGTVGKVALVDNNTEFVVLSSLAILTPNLDLVNPSFLFYVLKSPDFLNTAVGKKTGVAIRRIILKNLKDISVPLPPLATQQKIVAKLDAIFAEIDKATAAAEANAKNAEALFQSFLKRIFDCYDEGWKEVTIGSLYKVASSKRVLKSDWKSEGVPFYRGREITSLSKFGYVENDLFITEKMYSEYSLNYGVPSADDIMVTAIGTIGNTYIVKNYDKFYFKDASVLWLKKEKDVDSKFVNYWFKSSHFTSQLDVGLGATVDTLTIGKVGGLRIKIPTLNTQKDIVAKLDALSSEIAKSIKSYKDKANELVKLKQSILKQAFAGELVKE
jgi:type I restriction enzyme S subunit